MSLELDSCWQAPTATTVPWSDVPLTENLKEVPTMCCRSSSAASVDPPEGGPEKVEWDLNN